MPDDLGKHDIARAPRAWSTDLGGIGSVAASAHQARPRPTANTEPERDDDQGFALEPEVHRRSGLSRTTRYRMALQGTFPRAVSLTPGGSRKGIPRKSLAAWERARAAGEEFVPPQPLKQASSTG